MERAIANEIRWKNVIAGVFGLLIVVALVAGILPSGNGLSIEQVRQVTSDGNLKAIAYYAQKYSGAHGGRMPSKMSDLVDYGTYDEFYPPTPYFRGDIQNGPPEQFRNAKAVNADSAYRLLNKPGSSIVVREKMGMWSDGTIAVCHANGKIERLTYPQLKKLGLP